MVNEREPRPLPDDPVALQIEQEVEEFLRDLTLEFPFPEIFETLRRHEFKDRFGSKILPLPAKKISEDNLKEIKVRVTEFLERLSKTFGNRYKKQIESSFRYYTETTFES